MKKGRRIKTLHQLAKAATERRSVIVANMWSKRFPAAVVMNWQAAFVLRAIVGAVLSQNADVSHLVDAEEARSVERGAA